MAIAMQRRLRDLQSEWRDSGMQRPFQMRIGVNTGYCTVGNFGSEDRMDYTIIGSPVNLAARLQSNGEPGGILLSHETYSLVKEASRAEREEAPIQGKKGFSKADPVTTRSWPNSTTHRRHRTSEKNNTGSESSWNSGSWTKKPARSRQPQKHAVQARKLRHSIKSV